MLSAVDPAVALVVDVQNTLVASALLSWGTPEQKKKYLPRLAADTVGAYALSEAGSGSDAFALQTRAVKRGSEYVLTGRKLWISNAKEAGLFIIFATVDAERRLQGHHRIPGRKRRSGIHLSAAKKTSWEFARRAHAS